MVYSYNKEESVLEGKKDSWRFPSDLNKWTDPKTKRAAVKANNTVFYIFCVLDFFFYLI